MTRSDLPKLIATDLDGTLVRSDDTVSPFSHAVLNRIKDGPVRFAAIKMRAAPMRQSYYGAEDKLPAPRAPKASVSK